MNNGAVHYVQWSRTLCTMEPYTMNNGAVHYEQWSRTLCTTGGVNRRQYGDINSPVVG